MTILNMGTVAAWGVCTWLMLVVRHTQILDRAKRVLRTTPNGHSEHSTRHTVDYA